MAATIPKIEPTTFRLGDTVKWTKSLSDYLPADSWVLTYSFANASDQHDIVASDNGDGSHLVTISAAVSATFSAGKYHYQGYVEKGGERFTVTEGRIEARAVLTSAVDARIHAETVLDALESLIEGKASSDAQSISVGGKTMTTMSPEELYRWRNFYRREVEDARRAERMAEGLGSQTMIRVRMQ